MAAPIKIAWNFNASIEGGPQLSESQPSIEVSAYDVIKATLAAPVAPATSTATDIHLQPVSTAGAVTMLAIVASKYSDKISYKVDAVATDRVFDGPHVFLGAGAVGFLNATAPQKLTFTNTLAEAVSVQVLIGRAA
jgi:hypothetical protein